MQVELKNIDEVNTEENIENKLQKNLLKAIR